ncbi:MAG: ATP synthase F1 subunit delta [Candidatus Omnitrophica bacterium]|nr:ATP synthase F1 subunit delta [Candidatus Omnitrophota bacterium]
MSDSRAARRYAQAIFSVAKDQNVLAPLAEDMTALRDTLKQSLELRLFIQNPILEKDEQSKVVRSVFEGRGHPLLVTFLLFLIEKSRLKLLSDITEVFDSIFKSENHLMSAQLEVEREIEPSMLKELNEKISQRFGKKVETSVVINPELLGGFKLHINDLVFDASLKTQLGKFQENVFSTI